jgi:hypothetical protein
VSGEKKKREKWLDQKFACRLGFISGGNKLSNFWAFANWLFAAAFVSGMSRKEIDLAETATVAWDMVFFYKDPQVRDEESLISIPRRSDVFHVVDGIFLQWSIG